MTLIILFLVLHFNFLFVPCGRLSWLPVSFLLHVKHTLSYRIVSYSSTIVNAKLAEVDIRATTEAHSDIADDLLAIHRLSGADTVVSLHGIGKATVIKVSNTGRFSLSKVGDVTADTKSLEAQATNFICTAYGKIT